MENKDTYKIYWRGFNGLEEKTYNKINNSEVVKELLETDKFYLEFLLHEQVQYQFINDSLETITNIRLENTCAKIKDINDRFCTVELFDNYLGNHLKDFLKCGKYSVRLVPMFIGDKFIKLYLDIMDNR